MTKKTKTKTKKQKELAEIARNAFWNHDPNKPVVRGWSKATPEWVKEDWRRVVNTVLEEAVSRMEATLFKK